MAIEQEDRQEPQDLQESGEEEAEKKPRRNTKRPGRKTSKKVASPAVSTELYKAMYLAYYEVQTAAHVSRVTGVSISTAQRYIDYGHPKRGLVALKDRFKNVMAIQRAQEDYDLAKSRAEFQKVARITFMKLAKRVQNMNPNELSADKAIDNLSKLMALMERTFGEAEHTHEIRGGKFADCTLEELKDYLEKGIPPKNDV